MIRRLLLVDDDPHIGQALRRIFRPWVCELALSGGEALSRMAEGPFDAVVTDVRMPDMDGVELLRRVADRWPRTVRVALSGDSSPDAMQQTLIQGHQYFAKPYDSLRLRAWLSHAFDLRDELHAPALEAIVGSLRVLPSPPQSAQRIQRLCARGDYSLDELASVVATDPGLMAKVLQVANSAALGTPRPIIEVRRAVHRLGTSTVRALALLHGTVDGIRWPPGGEVRAQAAWSHAIAVAALASTLAESGELSLRDEAFLGGMLHDLGRLVLLAQPVQPPAPLDEDFAMGCDVELARYGASHDRVGAYLQGLWSLPDVAVRCALYHHRPSQGGPPSRVLAAVHFADIACLHQIGLPHDPVDTSYLRAVGVDADDWAAAASRWFQRVGA